MSWNDTHYDKDRDGNFTSKDEMERAVKEGNLERRYGRTFDRETGEEYWPDGTKKP